MFYLSAETFLCLRGTETNLLGVYIVAEKTGGMVTPSGLMFYITSLILL
jgi:hypothetical protein